MSSPKGSTQGSIPSISSISLARRAKAATVRGLLCCATTMERTAERSSLMGEWVHLGYRGVNLRRYRRGQGAGELLYENVIVGVGEWAIQYWWVVKGSTSKGLGLWGWLLWEWGELWAGSLELIRDFWRRVWFFLLACSERWFLYFKIQL